MSAHFSSSFTHSTIIANWFFLISPMQAEIYYWPCRVYYHFMLLYHLRTWLVSTRKYAHGPASTTRYKGQEKDHLKSDKT